MGLASLVFTSWGLSLHLEKIAQLGLTLSLVSTSRPHQLWFLEKQLPGMVWAWLRNFPRVALMTVAAAHLTRVGTSQLWAASRETGQGPRRLGISP